MEIYSRMLVTSCRLEYVNSRDDFYFDVFIADLIYAGSTIRGWVKYKNYRNEKQE